MKKERVKERSKIIYYIQWNSQTAEYVLIREMNSTSMII